MGESKSLEIWGIGVEDLQLCLRLLQPDLLFIANAAMFMKLIHY